MDPVAITVGLSWLFAGLLLTGMAIPLARGRVGRNSIYGIRFPQSFQSEDAWFAINHFGGRRMIIWSVPLIIVGLVSLFLPLRSHTALTLSLGFIPLIFVFIPMIESWRFARNYRSKA